VLSQTAQGALLYGLLILIVDQTSSSIWSSLFVICSIIPSLLLGLVGGAVADRLPQRALMIFLNLMRAAVVAALIWRDRDLTLVFSVTLAIWSVHQFYAPAESAFLAHVVPAARFGSASSLSNLALSLAQVLGMVLLAPLLLKLGRPLVLFALCSLLFIVAAALLMRMGQVKRSPTVAELSAREPRPVDVSLRAGWRAALQDPVSFAAMLDWVLIGVGLSTLVVIVPQYLERVLDTSSENTVYVFAPAAIGLVAGLQVAPYFGRLLGFGRLATIGLVAFAVAVGLMGFVEQVVELLGADRFPLATLDAIGIAPNVGATMLISIPAGFAVSLVTVSARTELMLRIPEEVRARVFATQMTLGNLAALVPTLLAGVLIDTIGVAPVAVVVAVTLVTGALYGRRLGGRLRAASQAPVMRATG
jgi:MFS family permease